jgi:hypothetical protein
MSFEAVKKVENFYCLMGRTDLNHPRSQETVPRVMAGNIIRLNDGWRMNEGHHMDEPPAITPTPPPVPQNKKGRKIMSDYVPDKRDQRYRWWKNLSSNVTAEAVKFGAPSGDATAVKAQADGVTGKMDATDTAQEAVDAARLSEGDTEAAALQIVRAKVKNWKTLSGWRASGSETTLQLSGSGAAFDPNSYKAALKVSIATDGGVRVDFPKKGVEGVNIYERIAGTTVWHKAGSCNHSPFIDHTPLTQTGVAETREYMDKGVVNDAEIGQASDPAIITVPA